MVILFYLLERSILVLVSKNQSGIWFNFGFFAIGTKSSFGIGSFENKCFWEKQLEPR